MTATHQRLRLGRPLWIRGKDYHAIQEPGAAKEVRAAPRGREDLEPDVRGMEPRDREQEAARARWIEVQEVERGKVDGKTTSCEEEVSAQASL